MRLVPQSILSVSHVNHVHEWTEVISVGRGVKQGSGLYFSLGHYAVNKETQ